MATKKAAKKGPNRGTTARRVARNVVGIVKNSQVIEPKQKRKKEKHKQDLLSSAGDV